MCAHGSTVGWKSTTKTDFNLFILFERQTTKVCLDLWCAHVVLRCVVRCNAAVVMSIALGCAHTNRIISFLPHIFRTPSSQPRK